MGGVLAITNILQSLQVLGFCHGLGCLTYHVEP